MKPKTHFRLRIKGGIEWIYTIIISILLIILSNPVMAQNEWQEIANISSSEDTVYIDDDLEQGVEYEYKVEAIGSDWISNTAQGKPVKVVLLIRGWGNVGRDDYWKNLKEWLEADGFEVWFPGWMKKVSPEGIIIEQPEFNLDFEVDGTQDYYANVYRIKSYIEETIQTLKPIWEKKGECVPKNIGIICHSYGGLLTRAYASWDFGSYTEVAKIPIKKVVQLSPINSGAYLGNYIYNPYGLGITRLLTLLRAKHYGEVRNWPSTPRTTIEGAYEFNKIFPYVSPEQDWYTIAGTNPGPYWNGYWHLAVVIKDFIKRGYYEMGYNSRNPPPGGWRHVTKTDGFVSRFTSHGEYHPAAVKIAKAEEGFHIKGFKKKEEWPSDHSAIIENEQLYKNHIKPWLLDQTIDRSNINRSIEETQDTENLQFVQGFSDGINNYEIKQHITRIDTSAKAEFILSWLSGNIDFALHQPDGSIIDQTIATSNPNIEYKKEQGFSIYIVENPLIGDWIIEIESEDVSNDETIYSVSVMVENDLSLTLSRSEQSYELYNTVPILATLEDGDENIIGANIVGKVLKPDGTEVDTTFYDDGFHGDGVAGDGVYGTFFSDTLEPGIYGIGAAANGQKAGGEAFSRIATGHTTFTVFEPNVVFTDTYDDYGLDLDYDDLIEYIVIEVGIQTFNPGFYIISGSLEDEYGNYITSAFTEKEMNEAGFTMVLLKFDGNVIFNSNAEGSFKLTNLNIFDGEGPGRQLDSRENAYTTAGFVHEQFSFKDKDSDKLSDYQEEEIYKTHTDDPDTDGDGINDGDEVLLLKTNPLDSDTDDDGISDGDEDANHNAVVDDDETNPRKADTDNDNIQDGTEQGITQAVPDPDNEGTLIGTDLNLFQPDIDPTTTTNPLNKDSDSDGWIDGKEDINQNGQIENDESDPNDSESKPSEKGDIDGDKEVDLVDAILTLQLLVDMNPINIRSDYALSDADVNENYQIGIEEAIYILEKVSGLR